MKSYILLFFVLCGYISNVHAAQPTAVQIVSKDGTCLALLYAGKAANSLDGKQGYMFFVKQKCDKEQYEQIILPRYSPAHVPQCVELYWKEKVTSIYVKKDGTQIKVWRVPARILCPHTKAPTDGSFLFVSLVDQRAGCT